MPAAQSILWLSYIADEDTAGNITITATNLTPVDVERIHGRLTDQQRGTIVEALERGAIVLSGRQDTHVSAQLLNRMLDDVRSTGGHPGAAIVDDLKRRLGLYREP